MAAGTLPEFPAADLGSMIDACDAILAEHGLQAVESAYGKTDKKIIYDIDDATRFDVDGGPDQTGYDTLVSMVAERGEVRVSGSLHRWQSRPHQVPGLALRHRALRGRMGQ